MVCITRGSVRPGDKKETQVCGRGVGPGQWKSSNEQCHVVCARRVTLHRDGR